MGLYAYSVKVGEEKKAARAQVHDVNASYKDLSQVLGAIRHKPVKTAIEILDQAITKKKAIPYKKFATHLGHRSELGGQRGRYPIKEAKIALQLLKNGIANAEGKGLDKEKLVIAGVVAHKQNSLMRARKYWASGIIIGYGRQSYASKYETCWAELTLVEKDIPKKESRKRETKKKEDKTSDAVKSVQSLNEVHKKENHAKLAKKEEVKRKEEKQEKKEKEEKEEKKAILEPVTA